MKNIYRIIVILVLLTTLLIPVSVSASGLSDDKVIFGGNFTLKTGETIQGDLVAFGGNISLEATSSVNGDTVVFGGNVTSNGTINGNLIALGGIVELQNLALINGDLTALGSSFEKIVSGFLVIPGLVIMMGKNLIFFQQSVFV